MKNSIATMLFLLFVSVMTGTGQTQSQHPYPFGSYPAGRLYKGEPVLPKLTTPTQREFRTVLRNGARKGPNFAGHYTLVEWGCGSNCVVFAVVDVATGKVHDRNMPFVNDGYPCGLLYNLESTLFVVEKSSTPNGACEAQLYTWNGSRFIPVHRSAP